MTSLGFTVFMCKIRMMIMPWGGDTCVSPCLASMPLYSGDNILVSLGDPPRPPFCPCGVEADPTS